MYSTSDSKFEADHHAVSSEESECLQVTTVYQTFCQFVITLMDMWCMHLVFVDLCIHKDMI